MSARTYQCNKTDQLFMFTGETWGKYILYAKNVAYKLAPGNEEAAEAALDGLFEAARRFKLKLKGKQLKGKQVAGFKTYAYKHMFKQIKKTLRRPPEVSIEEPVLDTGLNILDLLTNSYAPFNAFDLKESRKNGCLEQFEQRDLRSKLFCLIMGLKPSERVVLKGRFFNNLTLDEIGKRMGLTRERVRQIEASALNALRKNPKVEELRIYHV